MSNNLKWKKSENKYILTSNGDVTPFTIEKITDYFQDVTLRRRANEDQSPQECIDAAVSGSKDFVWIGYNRNVQTWFYLLCNGKKCGRAEKLSDVKADGERLYGDIESGKIIKEDILTGNFDPRGNFIATIKSI